MNVIILTTGLSGSSVMTGFLAKSGLWTGDETAYKENMAGTYETFENKKLIELNKSLIKAAELEFDVKCRYDEKARERFNQLYKTIDTTKYKDFLRECDSRSPWIWKDPRLIITIGFWRNFLDLSNTKFIIIHRNCYELWKSQTIKRIVYSYQYLKKSELKTRLDLLSYLDSNGFSYISIEYDLFTAKPTKFIKKLNEFIGTNLQEKDWHDIYRKTSRYSHYKRTLLSFLIYLKNYHLRIK